VTLTSLCRSVGTLILLCAPGFPQDAGKPVHVVRASGEATVTAKPDRAQVTIGVVNHAPTAEAASEQNAAQTTQAFKAVKDALGAKGEIQTRGYSISPDYEYPKNGGTPKVTGYSATNTVLVTVDDLSLVGKVIDTATQAGANNINGIAFMLRDDQSYRTKALGEAALKARASAEAIAKALNLQVIGIAQAESIETRAPQPLMQAALAARATTPVETGTLDIHATVNVMLEVR